MLICFLHKHSLKILHLLFKKEKGNIYIDIYNLTDYYFNGYLDEYDLYFRILIRQILFE